MSRRIVVIGGLAAGPAAAAKARRVDPDAEVILLESGEHVSYGICEIPYVIGGIAGSFPDLMPFTPERLEAAKGVVVKTLHRVEKIHASRRIIEVRDFKRGRVLEMPYDRLVIATGSVPNRLGIAGEDARNVFFVKTLGDAHSLESFLKERTTGSAVVIGGGYIGMEMSEALVARGFSCTIIHQHDLPLRGLETATREAVAHELTRQGVRWMGPASVQGFDVTAENAVSRVRTNRGSVDADVVIVCIGVRPSSALAEEAGVAVGRHGGIRTDRRQQTNLGSIYAAGDCCEVRNLLTNRGMYLPLATLAARQGRVAGENAAGGSAVFKGAIRSIAVRVFGLEVARVGLNSTEAAEAGFDPVVSHIESDSRIPFFPGNERIHVVTIADRRSGRILGANVFGGGGAVLRANVLALAIQQKMTAKDLSETDLIYSPPFSPLWDPLLIAANNLRNTIEDQ